MKDRTETTSEAELRNFRDKIRVEWPWLSVDYYNYYLYSIKPHMESSEWSDFKEHDTMQHNKKQYNTTEHNTIH